MRRSVQFAALSLAVLALGACSKEKSVDAHNETPESVASKVAESGAMHFNPGRWEMSMKIDKLDLGDAPPEAKKMIAGMLGKERTIASCLTKEEAEKPTPKFFGEKSDNCSYEHFTMGGGKIDARLDCKGQTGLQSVTMNGSYTPDSYQMQVQSAGAAHAGMKMDMQMTMKARHVGECTGKEDS